MLWCLRCVTPVYWSSCVECCCDHSCSPMPIPCRQAAAYKDGGCGFATARCYQNTCDWNVNTCATESDWCARRSAVFAAPTLSNALLRLFQRSSIRTHWLSHAASSVAWCARQGYNQYSSAELFSSVFIAGDQRMNGIGNGHGNGRWASVYVVVTTLVCSLLF